MPILRRAVLQDSDELPFNPAGAGRPLPGALGSPPPFPRPASESAFQGQVAQGNSSHVIARVARSGAPEEIIKDHTDMHEVLGISEVPDAPLAKAGVALGYTIPGPKSSYMTARIDANVTLPCAPNDEAVKAAMTKATDYCKNWLDVEADAVQQFFAGASAK